MKHLTRQLLSALLWLILGVAIFLVLQWWQTRSLRKQSVAQNFPLVWAGQGTSTTAAEQAFAQNLPSDFASWRAKNLARGSREPVVLYFWASWCSVCHSNQGNITSSMRHLPILPIATQSGNAHAVAQHIGQNKIPWTSAVDESGNIAAAYGVRAFPSIVFVDAQGRIATSTLGYTTVWGMRARQWWAALQ